MDDSTGSAACREGAQKCADRKICLRDQSIGAVQSRKITDRSVHAAKEHRMRKCDLQPDDDIEAVNIYHFAAQVGNLPRKPRTHTVRRGDCPCQRKPLPLRELITVADKPRRCLNGIAAVQQEEYLLCRLPQRHARRFSEIARIRREKPAPCLLCHPIAPLSVLSSILLYIIRFNQGTFFLHFHPLIPKSP